MEHWLVENNVMLASLYYIFAIITLSIWGVILAKGTALVKAFIFYFKEFKYLFSDEFRSIVRVTKCLYDLNDCCILINKDVIGGADNKDYMISPMLLTIICNVIENEIEDYCHCGNMAYTPINYYDYLYYIRTGKIKDNTLDDKRVNALKNALNLCKNNLSFSYIGVQFDKAGLPWKTNNINIKPKWNI